jgi:hypothetical protein
VNNLEMAVSYERQAAERLRHAREALASGNYPYVVRQCQEAVEAVPVQLAPYLDVVGCLEVPPHLRTPRARLNLSPHAAPGRAAR